MAYKQLVLGDNCPDCGTDTIRDAGGIGLYCCNPNHKQRSLFGPAADFAAATSPAEIAKALCAKDEAATHDIKARVHRNMGSKEKQQVDWAAKARAFRDANPHVWTAFVRLAEKLINKGHKHIGVELIFNVIRWETMLESTDDTGFKINNNYKAAFARMFMDEYPQHGKIFTTRE